jgi:hypothetical protein
MNPHYFYLKESDDNDDNDNEYFCSKDFMTMIQRKKYIFHSFMTNK